jgi:hypothetical protein
MESINPQSVKAYRIERHAGQDKAGAKL